jgi:hypothetical protein
MLSRVLELPVIPPTTGKQLRVIASIRIGPTSIYLLPERRKKIAAIETLEVNKAGDQARALPALNYPHNQQQRSINRPHSVILKTAKRCAYF